MKSFISEIANYPIIIYILRETPYSILKLSRLQKSTFIFAVNLALFARWDIDPNEWRNNAAFLFTIRPFIDRTLFQKDFLFILGRMQQLRAFTCAHARNIYTIFIGTCVHWNRHVYIRVPVTIHDRARERQKKNSRLYVPTRDKFGIIILSICFYINVGNIVKKKKKKKKKETLF